MTLGRTESKAILPGQVIGIYGGGQLGRMLAMTARQSGYRVHVYTEEENSPAGYFAHQVFLGADDDEERFRRFAESIDVLTFEFENVSSQSLEWVPAHVPVRPGANVFWTTQDRLREKNFLRKHAIPLPNFAAVNSLDELESAMTAIGVPSVLKTSAGGYDGKGQYLIRRTEEAVAAWQAIGENAATLEAFIDLACEVSVIVAADVFGNLEVYGPMENRHVDHILDLSFAPANLEQRLAEQARAMARQIAIHFELIGLICVEFFVTRAGQVLVNEIAPRTHNSGHLTIEAFATSQFEQQLRCVCGLPLGSTEQLRPAAMANLLGDRWFPYEPKWEVLFSYPETYLHLYEKQTPRPGRKMGHLTSCSSTVAQAIANVERARDGLTTR